jgi:hypothetical protein
LTAESTTSAGTAGPKRLAAAFLILASIAAAGLLIWQVPLWQLAPWTDQLARRQALMLENELRQTLLLAADAALDAFADFV